MTRWRIIVIASLLLAGCAQWSASASDSAVDALRDPTTTTTTVAASPTSTAASSSTTCKDGHDRLQTYAPLSPLPSPAELKQHATGKLRDILDRGTLVAGVDENTLLLGYRNPSTNALEGFEIDLIRAIATALFGSDQGTVQFKTVTTEQKVSFVAKGKVDLTVSAVSITCKRRDGDSKTPGVEFSAPYFHTAQKMMVRASSDIQKLADLDGKTVCVTSGSTSRDVLAQYELKVTEDVVATRTECLADLQAGKTDAIFTHETFLWGFQAQDPDTTVLSNELSQQYYGVTISKDDDDVDLVRFVNAVIQTQRAGQGDRPSQLQLSYDRWFKQCALCAPIAGVVPAAVPIPEPDYGRPVP